MSALRVSDPVQFAERLGFLIDNAGLKSLDELSIGIGKTKGHAWWLLHPEMDNGPKRVNPQTAADCADFLADRGRLIPESPTLFNFLMGIHSDSKSLLKQFLKVAPTGFEPALAA